MNAHRFPIRQALLASCAAIAFTACQPWKKSTDPPQAPWQAEHLVTIDGFNVPE